MKLVVLGLLLAACQSAADDFPPGGGGGGGAAGGGGGGGAVDAGTVSDGGDAGPQLTGRVCLLTDLRQVGNLKECADTGAGHWTVSLGDSTAISGDDGAFTIAAPQGAGFVWHVKAGRIITSAMAFGTDNTIPVMLVDRYQTLVAETGLPFTEQQGSIVVRVLRGTTPVTSIVARADNDTTFDALYDGTGPDSWGGAGTGPLGMAWLPSVNVPVPARQVTVSLTTSTQPGVLAAPAVTVEDQTITFVTQALPALP